MHEAFSSASDPLANGSNGFITGLQDGFFFVFLKELANALSFIIASYEPMLYSQQEKKIVHSILR